MQVKLFGEFDVGNPHQRKLFYPTENTELTLTLTLPLNFLEGPVCNRGVTTFSYLTLKYNKIA